MSREAAIAKLERILGPEKARAVLAETLRAAGLERLDTAHDRLRFGRILMRKGGVFAAIGNSIAVQAILEGARDSATSSGEFERGELSPLPPAKTKRGT